VRGVAVARASFNGAADGVEYGGAVGGGGVEVAPDGGASERGWRGNASSRTRGLVAFRCLRAALGDVVSPAHGEVAGEQEDLFLVFAQPAGECVSGVVPGFLRLMRLQPPLSSIVSPC